MTDSKAEIRVTTVTTSPTPQRPGWMREAMPEITAWIDSLRAAFGAEVIDGQILRSMPGTPEQVARGERGQPTFYASENGHEIGTPRPADWGTAVVCSPPRPKPVSK